MSGLKIDTALFREAYDERRRHATSPMLSEVLFLLCKGIRMMGLGCRSRDDLAIDQRLWRSVADSA